jgi:hypothetical protein
MLGSDLELLGLWTICPIQLFFHVIVIPPPQADMASTFGATSTVGLMAAPTGKNVRLQRRANFRVKAAKELYFNKDGSAIKKLQVSFTILGHSIFNDDVLLCLNQILITFFYVTDRS